MKRYVFGDRFPRIGVDSMPNREKKLKRIRVDRALVVPFWRENNFFVFVLFVYLSFSLELPHTTTTKVTPTSKYPMKIKVCKVVPKKISDFTPI